MTVSHPIHRRFWAEDLVRLRRSDEHQRYAASQRRGRIDPNPHQIDAVIFALRRIREGGCILADEVGLGKTIEAGLVMAQLIAEFRLIARDHASPVEVIKQLNTNLTNRSQRGLFCTWVQLSWGPIVQWPFRIIWKNPVQKKASEVA